MLYRERMRAYGGTAANFTDSQQKGDFSPFYLSSNQIATMPVSGIDKCVIL